MARHQLNGGGGIAFQRSGVGDWVALLSKGFTQRHHQSTHFSFFRGYPSVFFSTTPVCLGLKDKNEKGVGVLRFNGAAWETGWHFCPRDSLNVIINQPTSLLFFFFEGAIESSPLCTETNTRGEKGCGDRPNTNSLSALSGELSLTG